MREVRSWVHTQERLQSRSTSFSVPYSRISNSRSDFALQVQLTASRFVKKSFVNVSGFFVNTPFALPPWLAPRLSSTQHEGRCFANIQRFVPNRLQISMAIPQDKNPWILHRLEWARTINVNCLLTISNQNMALTSISTRWRDTFLSEWSCARKSLHHQHLMKNVRLLAWIVAATSRVQTSLITFKRNMTDSSKWTTLVIRLFSVTCSLKIIKCQKQQQQTLWSEDNILPSA